MQALQWLGLLAWCLSAVTLGQGAKVPYCTQSPLWFPGGMMPSRKSATWGAKGPSSQFLAGPCLQVSGLGTIETPYKKVIVIDRSDLVNTYMKGRKGHVAFAEEIDLATGGQRPLDVITNAFCSTSSFLRDGTFLNFGGGNPNGGGFSVRALSPCTNGKCDFTLLGHMTSWRWYPTSQLLGDGRVLIVGGSTLGVDQNSKAVNNPSIEYWPRLKGQKGIYVDFLKRSLPYNLYPFVHLLPSSRVFIFAANSFILFDTRLSAQVGPEKFLLRRDAKGSLIFRSYPLSATSAMFPLRPERNYAAEIMICGGGSASTKDRIGHPGNSFGLADPFCYRIEPESQNAAWVRERMKMPRVMPNAVLLPDGNLLIMSGAQTGYAGIPNSAHRPCLTPEMYNTRSHQWYARQLATSRVPRVYHASALLLHDGTVFLSGSNPNSGIVQQDKDFPTTFRTEFFWPPYLYGEGAFPSITKAPPTISLGQIFSINFNVVAVSGFQLSVVLVYPGFSTHGANHGARNVELQRISVQGSKGQYGVTVKAPPSHNVAPPTWYWLFLLVNGKPNREGQVVYVS